MDPISIINVDSKIHETLKSFRVGIKSRNFLHNYLPNISHKLSVIKHIQFHETSHNTLYMNNPIFINGNSLHLYF